MPDSNYPPSSIAIISKSKNLDKSIQDSMNLMVEKTAFLKKGDRIFIQIDLSVPEGYPSITNQTLLSNLVDWCLKTEPDMIYIGSLPKFGISSEYVWTSMGYSSLFTDKRVEFIALDKDIPKKEINVNGKIILYPEIILSSNIFISIVNVKADPIYQLQLGIYNSCSILEWNNRIGFIGENKGNKEAEREREKEREKEGGKVGDKGGENESNLIVESFLIRPPDVIIYDLTNIISYVGPVIYSDTNIIKSDLIFVSNDSVIAELIIGEILGINKEKNIILNIVNEKDPNLINKSRLNQFLLMFRDEKENIKVVDLLSQPNNLPQIKIPKIPNIQDIFPKKIFLYEGKYDPATKRALYDLILLLKTGLIKDFENVDGLNILVGENPPEPKNLKKIKTIVFGDQAIKTSDNMEFRILKSQKKVKTEEELEKARIKYQSDQRDKLLEWESKKLIIKENITKQFKDDQNKQDRAFKSLERRDTKFIENQKKKYEKFVLNQNKKQKKAIEKSKVIKYKLNKRILEINGNPPKGFEYIGVLIKFLGKTWVPTLNLFNNVMDLYYNRAEYLKQHKTYSKERKKFYKKRIEDMKIKKGMNNKDDKKEGSM